MNNLIENQLKEIKTLMAEVLENLNELDTFNFDTYFPFATEKMKKVASIKKELRENYQDELEKNSDLEKEIEKMAKQIKETYDNVIERFEIQKHELEIELQNFYNKKKLLIYRR